jgi:hypothetical protein
MVDAYGICGILETIENILQTRERDREIADDENVTWRNIDANCLLDVEDKYSNIYCTLP